MTAYRQEFDIDRAVHLVTCEDDSSEYEAQLLVLNKNGALTVKNDECDPTMVAEYDKNVADLIKEVRKELNVPKPPFVITGTGQLGNGTRGDLAALCDTQRGMGEPKNHPEVHGTVASVETRGFARPAKASSSDLDYHWSHNGESHDLIGEAMGKAMLELLKSKSAGKGALR